MTIDPSDRLRYSCEGWKAEDDGVGFQASLVMVMYEEYV